MDQGGRSRNKVNIWSSENDLILDRGTLDALDLVQQVHNTHKLLTQEIANFDRLTTVGDICIDREVGVDQP